MDEQRIATLAIEKAIAQLARPENLEEVARATARIRALNGCGYVRAYVATISARADAWQRIELLHALGCDVGTYCGNKESDAA